MDATSSSKSTVKVWKPIGDYGVRLRDPALLDTGASLWLANRMYKEFSERDEFSPVALESIATELLIAAARKERTASRTNPASLVRPAERITCAKTFPSRRH